MCRQYLRREPLQSRFFIGLVTGQDGNSRSSNRRRDYINHLASPEHDDRIARVFFDPPGGDDG